MILTWEQFVPPHYVNTSDVRTLIDHITLKIEAEGEDEPFCNGIYRLFKSRFSIQPKGLAFVATFDDVKVGVVSGKILWVRPDHRRLPGIDLAAELMLVHAMRSSTGRGFKYTRTQPPISMTSATVKASKRSYKLAVERGLIEMPAGYVVPG